MDLIISSGYPSPYGNISAELKAAQADPSDWYPMTVDFGRLPFTRAGETRPLHLNSC